MEVDLRLLSSSVTRLGLRRLLVLIRIMILQLLRRVNRNVVCTVLLMLIPNGKSRILVLAD